MKNNSSPQFDFNHLPEGLQFLIDKVLSLEEKIELLTPKEPTQVVKPVTQTELCKHYRVSPPTINKWERNGVITSVGFGRAKRYDLVAVKKALLENNLI